MNGASKSRPDGRCSSEDGEVQGELRSREHVTGELGEVRKAADWSLGK